MCGNIIACHVERIEDYEETDETEKNWINLIYCDYFQIVPYSILVICASLWICVISES